MTANSLRRRCKARLQALGLRPPVGAERLIATLQRERGRRIRVLALPEDLQADAPCGLWIAYAEEDVVLIEQATSPMHRLHILFHELAHIVCGHVQSGATSTALPRLFTRLDATTVRSVLARTRYDIDEEREAELLASMMLARRSSSASRPQRAADADVEAVLRRVSEALGGQGG